MRKRMIPEVSRRTLLQSLSTALAAPLEQLPSGTPQGGLPRVSVHPGGRYLQTSTGKPFFWLADTAWQLLQWLNWDDCRYYLHVRARQGYNVIQIVALCEFDGVSEPTAMGFKPFQDLKSLRPNDEFFGYIRRVIDEAASLGIYVALLPTWGARLTAPWGPEPRLFRMDNLDQARSYTNYLARLLRDRTNVIWMLGGDRPARLLPNRVNAYAQRAGFPASYDFRPIWDAMAAGILDEIAAPLLLYHPNGGEQSTSVLMSETRWLSVNGMQSGHGSGHNVPVWKWVARDLAMTPRKPTVDLEQNYEDHPVNPWPRWDPANGYFTDADVRRQAYRSVFAGACGVTYGNHSVWQFAGSMPETQNHALLGWREALHRPGARQLVFLHDLMRSRPFFTRIPAPELLPDAASETDNSRAMLATRDEKNSFAFVYYPNPAQPSQIDLTGFPESLTGWWFDPQTGMATRITTPLKAGRQTVTSPVAGLDWVLVVDEKANNFPPPGLA